MIKDISVYVCDECNTVQERRVGNSMPICILCESPMQLTTFFRLGQTGETKHLVVSPGYGHNTKSPFVQIESAEMDHPIQILPEEARAFALNILEAADGAESDAFIVEFFGGEMQQDPQMVAALLVAFRKYRNDHHKPTDLGLNTPAEGL